MDAERIKSLKNQLLCAIESEVSNLHDADCKELAEAFDMLKDLSEFCYYTTITDSMEKNSEKENMDNIHEYLPESRYYTNYRMKPMYDMTGNMGGGRYYHDPNYDRDMDMYRNRMYYTEPNENRTVNPMNEHNQYDGRAYMSRRTYMDAVDKGADKNTKSQEMDKYIADLSHDITEMVGRMDPNDKTLLKQKLANIASKL